jgi:hypothetical protein
MEGIVMPVNWDDWLEAAAQIFRVFVSRLASR